MENESNIQGDNNIVIQGVSDSTITLNVNGETQEILNKLDALQKLLENQQSQTIQTADKIYNIGSINEANFGFLVNQAIHNQKLPTELAENLITDDLLWVQSLKQALIRQNVSVGNKPWAIFQHYGWLIEAFLKKIVTPDGRKRNTYRLSLMAEAFQNSLRYLCYIQVTQILQLENQPKDHLLSAFINGEYSDERQFDYLNFLLVTTELLKSKDAFVPEISDLVMDLQDLDEELYGTVLFLERYRNILLEGTLKEEDNLDQILDEYLTALVFWLRQISFLAKYRLVSVKDIQLNYRLGTAKNFVHLYGELHGTYSEFSATEKDYSSYSIEEEFTYNHSVLLFNGSNVASCLENIKERPPLSLSPLIIDQSVYSEKANTQTPEIFYFIGKNSNQYVFVEYDLEIPQESKEKIPNNKMIRIKRQNIDQPKLDDLFEQLKAIFKPFKSLNQ